MKGLRARLVVALGLLVLARPAGAQLGSWSTLQSWPAPATGVVGIHASVLPTGKVLFFESSAATPGEATATFLWDPAAPVASSVTQTGYAAHDLFCSGHVTLADGRVMVVGGTAFGCGTTSATEIYNHATGIWAVTDAMNVNRWYGTGTTLGDGKVLATSGSGGSGDADDLPEIWDPNVSPPAGLWSSLPCVEPPTPCPAKKHLPLYPFMFVLPNGKVFQAGAPESTAPTPLTTHVLDLTSNTWADADDSAADGGSAVMYWPGLVMKSGGGPDPEHSPAVRTTEWIDMTLPPAQQLWAQSADMVFGRFHHNLVPLPDGTVLAVGGSSQGCADANGVLAAELWNPNSKTWTQMASMSQPRMYHSTAVLLPDGRVLSAGGGGTGAGGECPSSYATYQVYSPNYLSLGTAPSITSPTPTSMGYNTSFTITMSKPTGTTVSSVALLRPGSTTHAFDQNQRYVPLNITGSTATTVTVTTPINGNTAPPGSYMLFLVLDTGRPSVAYWVTVG